MSLAIFLKLIAIFAVVGLGWIAARARWLGRGDVARVLANAAFFLFIPALLFRTTARIDLSAMPGSRSRCSSCRHSRSVCVQARAP